MSSEPHPDDIDLARALRDALVRGAVADELAATEAHAPDHLLDLVVRTAAQAIPSPEGALFQVDPVARRLTFDVVIGETAPRVKDLSLPLGHGIAGLVAVSGQPIAVANAQQDPRHARDIAEKAGYFPTTILAVPVTTRDGSVIGVLELLDRQERPTFTLADMELLGRFAQLAAVALELRRAEAVRWLLAGEALAGMTSLPDAARTALAERIARFAERVAADPAARQALELAVAVAAVARHGEAEQRLCQDILALFATYLEARPVPGASLGDLW
jgi:GAF domain-containing protein